MRLQTLFLVLLLVARGLCAAEPPPLVYTAWLADPVGATLAAAGPASDPTPPPATPAQSTGPESPISIDYLKILWADTVETATGPFHWDRDEWRNAGLIGGGLILTGAFLDKPIRDAAQRNRSTSSDRFFKDIEKFGTKQYELPVAIGFYAFGALADNYEAKTVALDGFSASVISSLATSAIKGIVGRKRPNTGLGPHSFHPFQGDYSFPSGHATGAFAFASVIAAHYDDVWIDASAYTIASLVGVARIHLDAHWTSDVIAGGLIGGLIGHHLVAFNRKLREGNDSSLMPTVGTDGGELTLNWSF
jgi:membrane-associated phospholipid phosphatase